MLEDVRRFAALMPPISPDANKYTRGSVLVLAGSERFPGAAILTALAAARTGAGYTTLAIPSGVAIVAQKQLQSIPVLAVPENEGAFATGSLTAALDKLSHVDVLIVGPGLTITAGTQAFVLELLEQTDQPLLLDADGLNSLATQSGAMIPLRNRTDRGAPVILTPHAGELKRLSAALGVADDAMLLARETGAIVVAKGPKTIITDGTSTVSSAYGTMALAKAGTGDVLAGVIGSLLAQGATAFTAAELGVYIHSQAGRRAQGLLGPRSVMAEDLLDQIPGIIKELDEIASNSH